MKTKGRPLVATLCFTDEEIQFLRTLMRGGDDEIGAEIDQRFDAALGSLKATSTFFINLYRIDQAYGGPEEGGWYYPVTECVYSEGLVVNCESDIPALARSFAKTCIDEELIELTELHNCYIESRRQVTRAIKQEKLEDCENLLSHITIRRAFGRTAMEASIERMPALRHDTRRQYFS